MGNALRGLEVSDKAVSQGGLNGLVYVTHGQPQLTDQHGEYIPLEVQYYNNGGKEYRATGAKFAYALNTADGGKLPALYPSVLDRVLFPIDDVLTFET